MSHGYESDPEVQRAENHSKREEGCYSGLHNEKKLLLAGDLFLICLVDVVVAFFLSSYSKTLFHPRIEPLAATILLYPSLLYAFDLYNMERLLNWRDLVVRATYAAVMTGFLSGITLLLIANRTQAQVGMVGSVSLWAFLIVWRRNYNSILRTAIPRIPAVIVATGPSENLIKDLSRSPLFPYEIKASLGPWTEAAGKSSGSVGADSDITELLEELGRQKSHSRHSPEPAPWSRARHGRGAVQRDCHRGNGKRL